MRDLIILAYHRVLPEALAQSRGVLAVTTEQFDRQIAFFARRRWQGLTLRQLHDDYLAKGLSPKKVLVVTFDDGYRDNFTYAFPILQKHKVAATIFLVTGMLDSSRDLFFAQDRPLYTINDVDLALTKGQIEEMRLAGFEFGSHTVTHPRLSQVNATRMKEEVQKSRSDLEKYLGTNVASFCYPYGDVNREVVEAVGRAGYAVAVVTPTGPSVPITPLTLRRTGVYGSDSYLKFRIKCSRIFYAVRETMLWRFIRK